MSMRPRMSSRWPKRSRLKRQRPKTITNRPTEERKPAIPWLKEIEDLLNAIVSFTLQSIGTFALGLLVLFRSEPSTRLWKLQEEQKVLPWATALIATSALFSAISPVAFELTASSRHEWMNLLVKAVNVADYVERFLPTISVGLFFCGVAVLPWLKKPKELRRIRLFVATCFSIALIASLMYSVLYRTTMIGPIMGADKVIRYYPSNSARGFAAIIVLAFSAFALRATYRICSNLKPFALKLTILLPLCLIAGILGLLSPLLLVAASVFAIKQASPVVAMFKPESDPLEMAEFEPLEPICKVKQKEVECLFSASTTGKGAVLLDFSRQSVILTDRWLQARSRNALSAQNSVPEKIDEGGLHAKMITATGAMDWRLLSAPGLDRPLIAQQTLGSPFSVTVRFKHETPCSPTDVVSKITSGHYHWLYLQAVPVRAPKDMARDGHASLAAAIGPWEIPSSVLFSRCQ